MYIYTHRWSKSSGVASAPIKTEGCHHLEYFTCPLV